MISFYLKSLLTFNIVILVVGPVILGLLLALSAVFNSGKPGPPPLPPKPAAPNTNAGGSSRQPVRAFGSSDNSPNTPGFFARFQSLSIKGVLLTIWKQASFWIALAVTGVLQGLLVWGFVAFNSFVSARVFWTQTIMLTLLCNTDNPLTPLPCPLVFLLPFISLHCSHPRCCFPFVGHQAWH